MKTRNIALRAALLAAWVTRAGDHIYENSVNVVATEDLSVAQYKLITFSGTVCQAADTARVAGIMRFKATSGFSASAIYEGVTKGFVGSAVSTPGWPLKSANSGWLTAAASGDSIIGRAHVACSSGDLAPVMIDAKNLGIWHG